MGFAAGILAWRMEIGPLGWVVGLEAGGGMQKEEEKEKKKKIFPMCESIGHWPLRGHCPESKKVKV